MHSERVWGSRDKNRISVRVALWQLCFWWRRIQADIHLRLNALDVQSLRQIPLGCGYWWGYEGKGREGEGTAQSMGARTWLWSQSVAHSKPTVLSTILCGIVMKNPGSPSMPSSRKPVDVWESGEEQMYKELWTLVFHLLSCNWKPGCLESGSAMILRQVKFLGLFYYYY